MKLAMNISLLLFSLVMFGDKSYSLTDYKIKKFCAKEIRVSLCIKNLKEKRSTMIKGNLIEIPVIPYNR